jgi:hypothetical protein
LQGGKTDAIKEVLKSFKADHLDVVQARNTTKAGSCGRGESALATS